MTVRPDQRVSTRHRARPVALAERDAPAARGATVKCPARGPPSRSAKIAAESGRGWQSQVTLRVGGEQGDGRAVGQHRVPLDRHRALAVEPVPPGLQQEAEDAHRVDRVGDAVGGLRLAGADLDADVRARASWANAFSSVTSSPRKSTALADACVRSASTAVPLSVATTDSSIDLLAVRDVDVGPGGRAVCDRVERLLATSGSAPRVCTATLAGFVSSRTPGWARGDRSQLGEQPVVELEQLGCEPLDEADVELRAVAADEVDLARAAGRASARSRSARPETTATVVCGRAASARTAATASGSGTAAVGSSTSGASVPS